MAKPSLGSFHRSRRKAVSVDVDTMVELRPMSQERALPHFAHPSAEGIDLNEWAKTNLERIEHILLECGGALFRGFDVDGIDAFQAFIKATSRDGLLEYTYRSTPRTEVGGKIYTSTEYPADQRIPLHNENAYAAVWPMKIWFYCKQAAREGGETPIADSREVYRRIDPDIRKRFEEKNVMYVRNYGDLDLPWQTVFQTDDRAHIEEFCRSHNIEFVWKGVDGLQTRQLCQAVARHPRTGDTVWFNQAHLFHVASLPRTMRDSLLSVVGMDDLPRHAYYGDGSPIEDSVIEEINAVFDDIAVEFPWRNNDILLLDNMLTAHGRKPFKGDRKVVVGMAEPYPA